MLLSNAYKPPFYNIINSGPGAEGRLEAPGHGAALRAQGVAAVPPRRHMYDDGFLPQRWNAYFLTPTTIRRNGHDPALAHVIGHVCEGVYREARLPARRACAINPANPLADFDGRCV